MTLKSESYQVKNVLLFTFCTPVRVQRNIQNYYVNYNDVIFLKFGDKQQFESDC